MSTNYISNSRTDEPAKQYCRGGVKECGRIFCTTSLSLVPPHSLLLFARLSAALHQRAVANVDEHPHNKNLYLISTFLHTKTTSLLCLVVLGAAAAALVEVLAGDERPSWIGSARRRLRGAVVWIFSMQVCLSLWIYGFVEDGDDRIGGFWRSLVVGVGLHATVVLWRRKVVKPVVEEVVSGEGFGWVEDVVLAAAFGWLWWWRLRRQVEGMVAWRRGDVQVVDVVGWLLYGLTAAVGGVRVVKGLLWVAGNIILRSVNGKVHLNDI